MIQRVLLLSAFGVFAVVGSVLFFQKGPCEEPIPYRIDTVDPRFRVPVEEFEKDILRAKNVWEEPLGRLLFVYDPEAELSISLIYDDRQKITQQEQILDANIQKNTAIAASIKEQYFSLKVDYEQEEQAYIMELTEFNAANDTYNAKVTYWNNKGGAPKGEYEKLVTEKESLRTWQTELESKRLQVNALADSVNAFIKKYNLVISSINKDVNAINNDGLTGTEFEEGLYTLDENGERITIYQFRDKTDLIRVLAHELGHALTLGHIEEPDSIMYRTNQSDLLVASKDDLAALKLLCGVE
jgi:hypothetical protein